MKNIKTKKGEICSDQLMWGFGFLVLGLVFILIPIIQSLGAFFITIAVSTIHTSWNKVYYCKRCGNRHGEYPYNSCEKCKGREFIHRKVKKRKSWRE